MEILTTIAIVSIIVLLILFFVVKKILKTLFIFSLLIFGFILLTTILIISDAKSLSNLETSQSAFFYKVDNNIESTMMINFSDSDTFFIESGDLNTYYQNSSDQGFFKVFTFTNDSFPNLLSDNITLSENISFEKSEILDLLNDVDQDKVDMAFSLAVSDVLQNLPNQKRLPVFLDSYKNNDVSIKPPIKAISLLSIFPSEFINKLVSD